MSFFNRQFAEFKSIFVTENLLKENENHANIVTAATMLNLFIVILIGWILSRFNVSNSETINMTFTVINSFIGLFIPAIICFIFKGEKSWIKYMLFGMFILILVTIEKNMSYITAFLMVIPVILSARYYKKQFTILISIETFFVFLIASFVEGVNYIANYQSIISALLLYYVVVYACTQVSQSGKNMIEKQKEITAKGTRIETELNLAYAIQKNMLPSIFPPFPERDEIDIYASMIPAKEVGGDFYDMFLIDDDRLAFCVADVTGKGIPASLVMMISKILIKNVSKIDMDVSETFSRVNKMLCEDNEADIFVTSWFGILDLKSGIIEYVNAGHNPPLIYSKKNNRFEYLREKPNLVLAGMETTKYTKNTIQLEPGDRIFLYTDGVVEATNPLNKLYGEDRLIEFLNKNINLDVKETIFEIKKNIDEFVGNAEQFDDITMLELLYKEKLVSQTFNAEKKELPKVQKFVEKELEKYNCSKKDIEQINLIIEEVFVNISNYAYKDKIGNCTLTIKHEKENEFSFIIEDSGVPFNPLEKIDPDINLPADKRKIGGLGIFLTKKIMNDVKYRYENNKNILTILKKI